ncbi:hypothetical protein GTB64_004446 [Salmonella enterica]|nr:hypothetical protein [Salmonella enterica]
MSHIFATPRGYIRASILLMALNFGNIITFTSYFDYWLDHGFLLQGAFVAFFHVATIIALTFCSARFAAAGRAWRRMITLLEDQGFTYDEQTKQFRPGKKF